MGEIRKIIFLGVRGVFRISMDIYCTKGMGVTPKSGGYRVGGIGNFYLFSGSHKWRTPMLDSVKYFYCNFFSSHVVYHFDKKRFNSTRSRKYQLTTTFLWNFSSFAFHLLQAVRKFYIAVLECKYFVSWCINKLLVQFMWRNFQVITLEINNSTYHTFSLFKLLWVL